MRFSTALELEHETKKRAFDVQFLHHPVAFVKIVIKLFLSHTVLKFGDGGEIRFHIR